LPAGHRLRLARIDGRLGSPAAVSIVQQQQPTRYLRLPGLTPIVLTIWLTTIIGWGV
jgi:hypothetical protein